MNDGDCVVLAQLSWVTQDGDRFALGFAPDLASCYGHRYSGGNQVEELRGELDDDRAQYGSGACGYEFDTEMQDSDGWGPAGRLQILIDDGECSLRSAAWSSRTGDASSIVLRSLGTEDASHLVSRVWASAEHRGANEVAANLVRASTDKWFAFQNQATLDFELAEPTEVDRYILTSANDAPDRDPSMWTLRGSADGRQWRALDTRSGQLFPQRHQPRTYR
ncbi:MAG: hypothetical protein J2P17_31770, partial [Mycobacterium sp.]|nr:hypothetical protein [Mycobacterium sp.]